MAIALSEAKNMNQGGMLNNIYQRPMFQTPQTREASGIMAGVAPVRGFENGGYAGYMPDTGGYEGYLEDITADDVSDFFTTDKGSFIGQNEQGPTVTARDITDLFIVDPEDPIDVALATATAGLLAAGITAPAAMIAQLARMGYKGSKVIDKVSKAVEIGKSGTLKGLESTRQVSRAVAEIPDLIEDEAIAEELPQESRSRGIASLLDERSEEMPERSEEMAERSGSVSDIDIDYDRVRALSGMKYADGGIVSLKKGALVSKFAQEIIDVAKDIYRGEGVAKKMLEDAVKKGDVLVDEVPKVLRSIKSAVKKSQNPKTQKPKNPKTKKAEKPKEEKPKEEMTPPPEPPERPEGRAFLDDLAVRGIKKAGYIGSGLITGAGLFGYDALTGSGEEQDVKAQEIAKAKKMKAAEEAKLAEAEELRRIADEEYNNRSLLTKTSDFIGSAVKKLQDPRVQAGLAKAAQPSAGFVPRNMFSDINEGMREYDLERATIASSEPEIIQTQKALIGLIEENTGESLSKDSQLLILQSLFADEAAASNAATLFEYAKQNPQVVDQDFYQKALNEVLTGSTIGSAIGQIMNPQAQ
jgi:hypothetical protein